MATSGNPVRKIIQASYRFGWWDFQRALQDETFRIAPADNFADAKHTVKEAASCGRHWYHPPTVTCGTEGVEVPAGRFTLPTSHILTVRGSKCDQQLAEFLLLVLGFLRGMRFTIEGTGYLLRTPIQEGFLVGFRPSDAETLSALNSARVFWLSNQPNIRSLAFAALHWFLVSQSYRLQHDTFCWQYAVMDNIFTISKGQKQNRLPAGRGRTLHDEIPRLLAAHYRSPLPASFTSGMAQTPGGTSLSRLRNKLVHEAQWCGHAVGYAVTEEAHTILCELKQFNEQLILGFLDIKAKYRLEPYSGQVHGLDIVK